MAKECALSISGLYYSYKSEWLGPSFEALKDISLEIAAGESFGFLGHNGAGKTTAIKCILGLIQPTRGAIRVFGLPHHEYKARSSVGYLPEQPYFYDHLTVREIMQLYARLSRVPREDRNAAIANALERVKVSSRADSRMRTLSKGLTQRVAMAQAIVGNPRLLLLDEPFSGLDPIGRKEFKDLLVELRRNGTTIFMSSHILGDVEFLCDRVAILGHGSLKGVFDIKDIPQLASGDYQLVVRTESNLDESITGSASSVEEQDRFTRLTFSEKGDAEHALRKALDYGLVVESYQFQQGNLENLFVELVQYDEAKGE